MSKAKNITTPFYATMHFKKAPRIKKGPGIMMDQNGDEHHILQTDYDNLLSMTSVAFTTPGAAVSGNWEVVCRGGRYGIKLVGQPSPVKAGKNQAKPSKPKTASKAKKPVPMAKTPMTGKAVKVTAKPKSAPTVVRKNHFAICVDRSGSMSSIRAQSVSKSVNTIVKTIQNNAKNENQPTTISILEFGGGYPEAKVRWAAQRVPAEFFQEYTYRHGNGNTPLFECIGMAINSFSRNEADMSDANTSFFVYAITDGHENASEPKFSPVKVNHSIRHVQATDRWTFAFQLPLYFVDEFVREYDVPAGNVQGWDVTEYGLNQAAHATSTGISSYFVTRSAGHGHSKAVYQTNIANLAANKVQAKLDVVNAHGMKTLNVKSEMAVEDFIEKHTGGTYVVGSAWYQLTKRETVQPDKQIMLRERGTKTMYGGPEARKLIGLTGNTNVVVSPGDHGRWEIFVQSRSHNRKLVRGTDVIFIPIAKALPETWDREAAKRVADARNAARGLNQLY